MLMRRTERIKRCVVKGKKKDQAIISVALSINAQEHATCFESRTNYYNKTLKILPTPGVLGKFLQFLSSSNDMQRFFRCFCQFVQTNWETFAYLILGLLSQVFLLYLLLFPCRSALWVDELEFCYHRRLSQEKNTKVYNG